MFDCSRLWLLIFHMCLLSILSASQLLFIFSSEISLHCSSRRRYPQLWCGGGSTGSIPYFLKSYDSNLAISILIIFSHCDCWAMSFLLLFTLFKLFWCCFGLYTICTVWFSSLFVFLSVLLLMLLLLHYFNVLQGHVVFHGVSFFTSVRHNYDSCCKSVSRFTSVSI